MSGEVFWCRHVGKTAAQQPLAVELRQSGTKNKGRKIRTSLMIIDDVWMMFDGLDDS
jgi:hypothetical protein